MFLFCGHCKLTKMENKKKKMKRILKVQNNYYPSKKQERKKKLFPKKNLWSQDFFDINTKRWGFIEYYMLLGKR